MTRTPLAEVHTGARQYDARMSESLARAFPARLAPVLAGVVQALPAARLGPSGSVTASSSRTWAALWWWVSPS